jgi:glycosyltransferase involved in cell wall biosynthesis
LKIAVFLSEWPMGLLPWACTIVEGLANRGFDVHLYVRNGDNGLGLFDSRIKVFDLTNLAVGEAERLYAQTGSAFPFADCIDKASLVAVYAMGREHKYDWCLGLERMGLLLARTAALGAEGLLAYMSFELYEPAYPGVYTERLPAILLHEAHILSTVNLFLIQDSVREEYYYRILNAQVAPRETFYYPIGLAPATFVPQPKEWHRRYDLPHDTRIILYTGSIGANRFVEEFVVAAQGFPQGYKLVVHGPAYGQTDYVQRLQRLDTGHRTILSTTVTGWKERSLLVASADLGVVYYRREPFNDRETARSSDKVAAYLAAGIPFVGPPYETYQDVVGRYRCGTLIDDPLRLAAGVEEIFAHYDHYKNGAQRAFAEVYNAETTLDRLTARLHALAGDHRGVLASADDRSMPEPSRQPEPVAPTGVFENRAYVQLGYESLVKKEQGLDPSVPLFAQIKRISFQLSNLCNLEGIHKKCPLHCRKSSSILPSSIVTKVLDELGSIDYQGIVAFHIYNEPLIDPRLFSLIAETRRRCPGAKVYLLSNGYYLNQTILDELAVLGVWLLIVSAYSKADFERLSRYESRIPYKVFRATLDERRSIYDGPPLDVKAPCYPFVTDLSIACTGEVTLCCLDWDRRFVYGDLHEETLQSVLEKFEVRQIAHGLMLGERTTDICRRCDWVR